MTPWRCGGLGLLVLLSACSKTAHVSIGGTELCFPQHYIPGSNYYIWLMTRGLPKGDEALIYVPAGELKQAIPGYVVSHSNQYTTAVMHELNLLVSTQQGRYKELQREAWNIRTSSEPYFIEPDKNTAYTRIYPHFDSPSYSWHMALSPPPESSNDVPPEGWYVGYCLEEPGSFSCKQMVEVDGLRLWFDIDASNLTLRRDIAEYAEGRVRGWVDACKG